MSAYATYEATVCDVRTGLFRGTFQFRVVATPTAEFVDELAAEEYGSGVVVTDFGRTVLRNQAIGRKTPVVQKVSTRVRICA
jgi:hypothetical protein